MPFDFQKKKLFEKAKEEKAPSISFFSLKFKKSSEKNKKLFTMFEIQVIIDKHDTPFYSLIVNKRR